MGGVPNIWADEWEHESHEEWAADRPRMPRGEKIGATLYELARVARAASTTSTTAPRSCSSSSRAPDAPRARGERILEEGDVVHFPVGPDGAHQLSNRTDEPVRYLMVANRPRPRRSSTPTRASSR